MAHDPGDIASGARGRRRSFANVPGRSFRTDGRNKTSRALVPLHETLPAVHGDQALITPEGQDDPELQLARKRSERRRNPTNAFEAYTGGLSLRAISPREMANVSLDLYAAGLLTYDEYEVLAFQPELHPDYDATVGALTGEPAQPDTPRDFIACWDERLSFVKRYNPQNTELVRSTNRILRILIGMDQAELPKPSKASD